LSGAPELPVGLLDAFKLMALDGVSHCQAYGGPFEFRVTLFKRDPKTEAVGFHITHADKTTRSDAAAFRG